CGYDTKIYSHVWKAPTQAIKYQRFQRTLILWRLGRCVIIQNFNELLIIWSQTRKKSKNQGNFFLLILVILLLQSFFGSPVKPCVGIWINPINLLNQLNHPKGVCFYINKFLRND
ncbi:MAG: hypothetical protein MR893_08590, partial [Prevotellaceae bacterium]|nr:hypothetical protein [Prevotellaceae bacterium]